MRKASERPYYALFVREGGLWTMEFGDYSRDVVKFEQQDWLEHFTVEDRPRRRRVKDSIILELKDDKQWRIDAVFEALNALDASNPMAQAIGISILTFKLGG
jgi:hypothetical protein